MNYIILFLFFVNKQRKTTKKTHYLFFLDSVFRMKKKILKESRKRLVVENSP